jgi:hypothetical protein
MRRQDLREVVERLDQVIETLNRTEEAQRTAEQARAEQDKLNTKTGLRWQSSLTFLSMSLAFIALGVAMYTIKSVGNDSVFVIAAGFVIYCLAAFGLLTAERSARRSLAKEQRKRASK